MSALAATAAGCRMLILALVTGVAARAGANGGKNAAEFLPVAVRTAPGTEAFSPAFAAEKMIDGDLGTYACLLDDSRTGRNAKATPPNGSAPVTGTFTLDLGAEKRTTGLRFVARNSWVLTGPEEVSVFVCADAEGHRETGCLARHAKLPPTVNSYSAFVQWPAQTCRYLKVVVHDAYQKRKSFPWQKYVYGWARSNGDAVSGCFEIYNTQIAEVRALDGTPADLPLPNDAATAFPRERLERDWIYQDFGLDLARAFTDKDGNAAERRALAKVLAGLGGAPEAPGFAQASRELADGAVPGADPRWRALYLRACAVRRRMRLEWVRARAPQFIYTKNHVFGSEQGLVGAYDQQDDQVKNGSFADGVTDGDGVSSKADGIAATEIGSQLCLGTIRGDGSIAHEVLLDRPKGLIAHPALSWDGKTLAFAMRDDFVKDVVSLYTMDLASRRVTRITHPLNDENGHLMPVTDTEPAWLPDGRIVFTSTRYSRICDCWYRAGGDIYTCNADGSGIRRLTNDQLMSNLPQVTGDGRIVFTRWDYNDRTALYLHPLIMMNPDGTGQTEWYGNNSMFPSSLLFAHGIPGSMKLLAIVGGHHMPYKGKLALVDRQEGTQAGEGIEFVAGAAPDRTPGRKRMIVKPNGFNDFRIDAFGQDGPQWLSPYPFDETHYFCSFQPEGLIRLYGPYVPRFGAYYMDAEGNRELLAYDWRQCTGGVVPLMPRPRPIVRPDLTDQSQNDGIYYVQDVYFGPGLKGVPRGTVKKLRVVALEYRTARLGWCGNGGECETGLNQTPISLNSGSWDVKHVLGEVDVEADGSCCFTVPARQAVYFQLLDDKGFCVQSMRSWSTLQPGEKFGCIGCHENKQNSLLTAANNVPRAMKKDPQKLRPFANGTTPHPLVAALGKGKWTDSVELFLGVNAPRSADPEAPVAGFSYRREIQPILDRSCVKCHDANHKTLCLTGDRMPDDKVWRIQKNYYNPKRAWSRSYVELTKSGNPDVCPWMQWLKPRSRAEMLPPYHTGACRSKIFGYFDGAHHGVKLTDHEKRVFACWLDLLVPYCGSYAEANTWTDEEKALFLRFQNKRVRYAAEELRACAPQQRPAKSAYSPTQL